MNSPHRFCATVRSDGKGALRWYHVHLFLGTLIALIIVAILFFSGKFAYDKYNAAYFRYHCTVHNVAGQCLHHTGYSTPLHVPTEATGPVYFPKVALPSSGGIDLRYFPAIGDQDGLGSCAAWATNYYIASYVYRKSPHAHWWRFSPRYTYDRVSLGQDAGSYFDEDVTGPWVKYNNYAWPAHGPDYLDYPIPSNIPTENIHFITNTISSGYPAGQGAVNAIRYELATQHNPVAFGFPVWPEYDNATMTHGFINSPTPAEIQQQPQGRGGHMNVIVGYNDTLSYGGETGFFKIANQWTKNFGINGYAWISYNFVAQHAWDIKYLTWGGAGATPKPTKLGPPPFFDPHAKHHFFKPSDYTHNPADNHTKLTSVEGATAWYVHNVYTKQGQNISGIINYWGDKFHIYPIGIAATIGAESDFDIYAGRSLSYYDTSFGLMQESLPTLQGYGFPANANWEYNPNNSIYAGAYILRQYSNYTGLNYAPLDIAWNAGPGNGATFYANPYGQAATNYYGDFLPWFNYAIAHFSCYSCSNNPIPAPYHQMKFNPPLWNYYRWHHHRHLVGYKYHGKLSWIASIWVNNQLKCRGAVTNAKWNSNSRFNSEQFQGCAIYTWPRYNRSKIKYTSYLN